MSLVPPPVRVAAVQFDPTMGTKAADVDALLRRCEGGRHRPPPTPTPARASTSSSVRSSPPP